jgi:methyl-accepting chemotaxis protein
VDNTDRLPSGREFRNRFIAIISTCGTISAAIVLGYVVLLLRMPPEQLQGLGVAIALIFLPAAPFCAWGYSRAIAPVVSWLDQQGSVESLSDDQISTLHRAAFDTVINMPTRVFGLSFVLSVAPATAVDLVMFSWFEEFRLYHASLMAAAIFSAAGLTSIIEAALLKRWLEEMRSRLTLAVANPMQRSELTRPVSLMAKLQVVITLCMLVPVVFAALVGHTRAAIPAEQFANTMQFELGRTAAAAYHIQGEFGIAAVVQGDLARALKAQVVVLDRKTGASVGDTELVLTEMERERILDSKESSGSGGELHASNLYTWENTADGTQAIVVMSARSVLDGDAFDLATIFGGIFVACLVLGLGVGWLIAQDVGGATLRLGHVADRMAAGDLRRFNVLESEDELGTLGRAFDWMATSLRGSVGEVSETADGIEETSTNMSNVARELHGAAQTQGSDVTFVVEAMDAVEAKALEISHSSVELSHLVGECTSSVLELGAAGDQLNQTAGSLADRVEVVSSTVEQTVRSVRNVGRETDALVEAAAETSASMKEMASAMGHVDATAAATASLSQQVVAASELGYEKVLATIEGIESIRGATDTAHTVITRLDGRAQEIGVVVEVISDVADETNLLALNAAIIAAQAGEHGRAFSVVATEIKGLANRVLLSTQEISELVASVQQESQSAINAMAEGARSVAAGVERSGEAGKSLEEIKRISHDSGQRIHEILSSVQEQTIAAGHVVDLMERVRTGVETIQLASAEQERGNELVLDATQTMREVAQQLHLTTAEQADGVGRIRDSIGGVQTQMESIDDALQEQSKSTNQVVGFLEEVSSRSVANERAARLMGESTEELSEQARRLRAGMGRFQR